MSISMIWAMGRNGVIGRDNDIPWRLPRDLAYFKKMTLQKTILMGRKTWESFGGRPLPQRRHLVVTGDHNYSVPFEEVHILHDLEEAMPYSQDQELMVIGGSQIYKQMLPKADRLYVTFIEEDFEGDTYFPEVDWSQWTLVSNEAGIMDENNPYSYRFAIYERAES
ncbi:dihydrofolate reductase [Paenibacillus sp. F411]|uniref:dihydrofolate reductase n=1 Tax=unclassified Paenibacillus TaxID=185978 RepID=UPI001AAF0FF8|nr:dihydrofolate reductase [Paenibacillus sp. F411]MBO2943009.1 dihydrofolate reductase [Paenibacillus sp. F411]